MSRELCHDARRDMRDVGCHSSVHDGSALLDQTGGSRSAKGLGAGGGLGKGILFVTYSLLVSGQGRRMEEIISWLSGDEKRSPAAKHSTKEGTSEERQKQKQAQKFTRLEAERLFSGLIVFDEAHKAKNLDADTQTARLVVGLQNRLPLARVLYVSATGVSDIRHMVGGVQPMFYYISYIIHDNNTCFTFFNNFFCSHKVYANRLGLWGAGSKLYPDFAAFQQTLSDRGIGSLEMLGMYIIYMSTNQFSSFNRVGYSDLCCYV